MSRIFVPTTGPNDWKRLLADPEKHWRDGYSAKMLAERWEAANGFPTEVARLLGESGLALFRDAELLLAIPEYQVYLPGGRRPSQSDLFVLARGAQGLIAMVVEGKVSEPFGPTVDEWLTQESKGRRTRLAYLKEKLGLADGDLSGIRYQLLHRAASAVIEAERFGASHAAMIVHSFSASDDCFTDYAAFVGLYGAKAAPGHLVKVGEPSGVGLYCGWARGSTIGA